MNLKSRSVAIRKHPLAMTQHDEPVREYLNEGEIGVQRGDGADRREEFHRFIVQPGLGKFAQRIHKESRVDLKGVSRRQPADATIDGSGPRSKNPGIWRKRAPPRRVPRAGRAEVERP